MSSGAALVIKKLGLRPYSEVWDLQRELHKQLLADSTHEILLLCEHPPVITVGRSGKKSNILVSADELQGKGVELYEVERGGDVTYHGPGQLVAYPIIYLGNKKRDVGWYMRSLEAVILQTLQEFDIIGLRIPGKTGVWTQPTENAIDFTHSAASGHPGARKIASLGVRISRWCTLHGISLNVRDSREGFKLIHPCGFTDIEMSSIEQETGKVHSVEAVQTVLAEKFATLFGYTKVSYQGPDDATRA